MKDSQPLALSGSYRVVAVLWIACLMLSLLPSIPHVGAVSTPGGDGFKDYGKAGNLAPASSPSPEPSPEPSIEPTPQPEPSPLEPPPSPPSLPAVSLPNLDALRATPPVEPEPPDADPSTRCSPAEPDCNPNTGTTTTTPAQAFRQRRLSPPSRQRRLLRASLGQMLAMAAHHFRRELTDASYPLLEPEPQSGGTYDDFVMARLDPDNRIGSSGEDPLSRNFNWSLPLVGLKGRSGLNLGLSLSYNSLVWTRAGSYVAFDADNGFPTPGFRLGFPVIYGRHFNSQTGTYGYLVLMPSGARAEVRQIGSTNTYEAADSSYLFLVDNGTTLLLSSTDGTQLSYTSTENGYRCTQVKDRNGNYLTVSHNVKGRLTSITDTLGRVFNFNYDSNLNLSTITQMRGGTAYEWARFGYANLTLQTNFTNLSIVGLQNGATLPVLAQVSLPGGTYYKFSYTTWGQVHKITRYAADSNPNYDNHPLNYVAYNLPLNATTAQTDCPRLTQRKDWAENWNNFAEAVTNYAVPNTVGQPTNTVFSQIQTADGTYYNIYSHSSGWNEGLPFQEDTWADAGQGLALQRRSTTSYTQDNTGVSYRLNPRVTETNISDSANNRRRNALSYSTFTLSCGAGCNLNYYLPSEVREYAADATSVLRTTQTDYNLDPNYTSRRIFGLASQKRVYDSANGNALVSKVEYVYDENGEFLVQQGAPIQHDTSNFGSSFVWRGNLTKVRKWDVINTAQFLDSKTGYNTTGSPIFARDPLNRQASISYSDSFSDAGAMNTYAFPSTTTDAEGNQAASQYSYHLGAVTRVQGPPTNVPSPATATGAYVTTSYDSAGRISQTVNSFSAATVTYIYPTSSNVLQTYVTVNSTSTPTVSAKLLDGAGRVRAIASEHPGSTGGYIGQLTVFDVMGRAVMVSNPTEINGGWGAVGDDAAGWVWSAQTYDWKGRPRISTNQDGSTRHATYGGCGCAGGEVVTLRDEVNRKQRITHDALGRAIKSEDLNADQSVYRTTTNTYDARDQITQIVQRAGTAGAAQQTTLTYDGYGRLASSRKPIQSSPSIFSYNDDGTLHHSTDARGATTTYSYSNRRQVTGISYSAPSPISAHGPTAFGYDAAGNRVWMTDATGRLDYYYDALSQLVSETRQFTAITSRTFTLNYTYNPGGELTSLTDPFGAATGYQYDVAGRLKRVTGSGSGVSEFISQIDYRAWGGRKRVVYSNALNLKWSFDSRLSVSRFEGLQGANIKFGAEYQTNADGSVRFSDDLTEPKLDRSYAFDQVGRISQARSGAEARIPGTTTDDRPYRQNYEYDVWDNTVLRTANHWDQDVSSGGVFVNDRDIAFHYDADGRYEGYGPLSDVEIGYDAAGQRYGETDRTITEETSSALFTSRKFDGDGQMLIEDPVFSCSNCPAPTPNPTYYIRSTVLEGAPVATVNRQAQPLLRYVYANRELIGSIVDDAGTPVFEWRHSAPSGSSVWKTYANFGNEGGVSRTEIDPVGADVGTDNPYRGGSSAGGNPSSGDITSRLADASDFSRCSINGMRALCSVALKGAAAGALDRDPGREVSVIRLKGEEYGEYRYMLGINAALGDGSRGWVPLGASIVEGNRVWFQFDGGAIGRGLAQLIPEVARIGFQTGERNGYPFLGDNPFPKLTDSNYKTADQALKYAVAVAKQGSDCDEALKEFGVPSLAALIGQLQINVNVFDGRSSTIGLPSERGVPRPTIASKFKETRNSAGAEVFGTVLTGRSEKTTFLNDYFFNPKATAFDTQQRALILLHEAVHQFGDKSDSDFRGSSKLTNHIAEKCFPALNAAKLLGNLSL